MRLDAFRRRAAVFAAACTLFAAGAGCGKKEPPPPSGGERINLNAPAEIENYKAILARDPNNLQAHINLGNLYFDTKQDVQAISHYRRALEIDPANANVRTDLAICYRRTGNPDKAIEELRKVISMDPRHAQSRYNLGIIYIHDKGDIESGIKAWEALLENVPAYPYRDSLRAEIVRMRAVLEASRGKGK